MHIHFLDPHHEGNSLIHRLDPRVKLILILAFISTTALIPNGAWAVYILLLALAVSIELLSELGLGFYLKRALIAIPFVLTALPLLVTVKGVPLFFLPFGLSITEEGLVRFTSIVMKSWISVQMAIVLASTTPFPDILLALRSIRLPRLLVAIIGLMWRYLFVLADEALRLIRARQARSGESLDPAHASGGSIAWRAKVTGGMAGSLFLRSLERSDRIYNAMLSRGYDGEIRSLPRPKLSTTSLIVLCTGLFTLGILLTLGIALQ